MVEDDIPSLELSAETVRMYARDANIGLSEAKQRIMREQIVRNVSKAQTLDELKIAILQMMKFG